MCRKETNGRLLRKGVLGSGETIQSYNHQKRDFRDLSVDEDNIDVVNDNEKESGEQSDDDTVDGGSWAGFLRAGRGAVMEPVKCKAVLLPF